VGASDKNEIIVGEVARERLVTHPQTTAAAFKRYMGTDKKICAAGRMFRAEELSALVLQSLKADAEVFLGESITEAVITVPAYFNDAQRKATKAAGHLAGLKVDRLLTEPTAAALAYGFATGDEESTILVIDMGGGTLDVSLLNSFEGIMEVKATAGDVWLGGEDFTHIIAATFMAEAGISAGIPPLAEKLPVHGTILRQAEVIKRSLSDNVSAAIEINYDNRTINWALDRERLEKICEPLMARVRLPLERALRDARMSPASLSRIVFAGGATRMPMFRRLISRLFRQLPIQHINPDEVVAYGAAVRAGLVARSKGLEEHVLTDVAPFTLGVEVSSRISEDTVIPGSFLPIIERNTVIPASRAHTLTTLQDNQTKVAVRVYQGESRMVRDNLFLGEVTVTVLPAKKGKEQIEVRFTYDASGLLEVDAKAVSQDHVETLVIEGNPGVLTKSEIVRKREELARLKVHPREDAQNHAILERANRLFEENLGNLRTIIGAEIDKMRYVIEGQDPEQIAAARNLLKQFLDSIDRSPL
jgi:molecular chaperone HscC